VEERDDFHNHSLLHIRSFVQMCRQQYTEFNGELERLSDFTSDNIPLIFGE